MIEMTNDESMFNNQYRMTKQDGSYLLVKASKDITFSDSHHELETVTVAVYPASGTVPDKISAARGIYQPNNGTTLNEVDQQIVRFPYERHLNAPQRRNVLASPD